MKTYLECFSCLVRQSLSAARFAGLEYDGQRQVLNRVLGELQQLSADSTPPQTINKIYAAIADEAGQEDIFKDVKASNTRDALALYPELKNMLQGAEDRFDLAVRLAIAGNIIDYAASDTFDLMDSVKEVLNVPLTENEIPQLKAEIEKAPWVLYVADNAGETVFDRLLIEEIAPKKVIYVVRGGPILNDATVEDAIAAGIDQAAELRTTGYQGLGVDFEHVSPEFQHLWDSASVIIAKGMANYETLSEYGSRIFFLLKVKCDPIAQDVGVPTGSLIVRRG